MSPQLPTCPHGNARCYPCAAEETRRISTLEADLARERMAADALLADAQQLRADLARVTGESDEWRKLGAQREREHQAGLAKLGELFERYKVAARRDLEEARRLLERCHASSCRCDDCRERRRFLSRLKKH
jgi:hypothetical protein